MPVAQLEKKGGKSKFWRVRSRGSLWPSELFVVVSSGKPRYFGMCCAMGWHFARIVGIQWWEVVPAWEGLQEPDLAASTAVPIRRWRYTARRGFKQSREEKPALQPGLHAHGQPHVETLPGSPAACILGEFLIFFPVLPFWPGWSFPVLRNSSVSAQFSTEKMNGKPFILLYTF